MLESTNPGILTMDIYRYARGDNLPLYFLESLTTTELLNLDISQRYARPKSRKRILERKREPPEKPRKEAQLVANSPPYTSPEVNKIDLTLGNAPNRYEIAQVSPVLSSGGW